MAKTWQHGRGRENMERGHGNMDEDMDMETIKRVQETKAQAIFLHPFTVFSSCKQKFTVCPFVDEEIKGSYSFANGLANLRKTIP